MASRLLSNGRVLIKTCNEKYGFGVRVFYLVNESGIGPFFHIKLCILRYREWNIRRVSVESLDVPSLIKIRDHVRGRDVCIFRSFQCVYLNRYGYIWVRSDENTTRGSNKKSWNVLNHDILTKFYTESSILWRSKCTYEIVRGFKMHTSIWIYI